MQKIPDNIVQLNPLSLSFKDSALETEFKDYYDYETRVFNRIGIALSFMGWFVLNIYCYFYYPQNFLHMTVAIVIFLYPLFTLILLITSSPRYVNYYQPLTALANGLAGLMFIYVGHFELNNDILTICGIIAVILFSFFILHLRFKIALLTTLVYVIAYQVSLLLPSVHENSDVALLSVILWLLETVCIVGGYSLERNSRKMFCQNKEIIHQQQVAEAATLAKSEFLANMSHEIRTPLNAINGMAYLALQTDLSTQQQDYLGKIQSSAQTLLALINDILDFSKVEAGKLDIEVLDFNLDEILTKLANLLNMNAHQKGIELLFQYTADVPQRLRGDPFRLGQILINLTNNAIKFTDEGEIIVKIELLLKDKQEVTLQFSVSDTGIGITKEHQNKLFQAFSQVDASTTRKYGGTGLGLAICERLVKLMGGSIWLESEPGIGSTFFFTAVLGYSPSIESNLTMLTRQNNKNIEDLISDRSADIKGAKILLVEDNEINQQVAQEILHQKGLQVDIAANGLQALEMLEEAEYDVVLMDVQMPVMDGYEATRKIRSSLRWANLPVIAMTAHAMSLDREKSLQAGMNDQVNKPINPDELLAALAKCIKTSNWPTSTSKLYREGDNAKDLPWPDLPGIMLTDGLARLDGNQKLYKKLLLQFRARNVDTLDNIKDALSRGDDKTANRLIHTLKGVAGNIGADQLAAVAAELETALIEGCIAVNDVLLAKFSASFSIVTDGIRAFEEAFASVPMTKVQDKVFTYVDVDIVRPLLINLAQMLESGSINSAKQLSVLDCYLGNTKVEKQFDQLRKDVDMFDMDSALGKLKAIASDLDISL